MTLDTTISACTDRKSLDAALAAEGYEHVATRDGWYREGGIVDAAGNRIATSARQYYLELMQTQKVPAIQKSLLPNKWIATEHRGQTHYYVRQLGPEPWAFGQITVDETQEHAERELLSEYDTARDLEELISWCRGWTIKEPFDVGGPAFKLLAQYHIPTVMDDLTAQAYRRWGASVQRAKTLTVTYIGDGQPREVPMLEGCPELLDQPRERMRRMMLAWQRIYGESQTFCRRWALQIHYYASQGERELQVIPLWCGDAPDELKVRDWSPFAIMAKLERFDKRAGYPWAWFWFMLHGNRIKDGVGEAIATAVQEGKIGLPPEQREVLLDWHESRFGF